jgi:predicted nuclease of predicted toxin-antitoxin system
VVFDAIQGRRKPAADVADALQAKGHDAMTVAEQGLTGKIDAIIAEICKDEGRAIITFDLDFANVQEYPPENYSGLIVLRLALPSRNRVMKALAQVLDLIDSTTLVGTLWIVEESRIRIRGTGP